MKIKYCPVPVGFNKGAFTDKAVNTMYFEPEPLLNELVKERDKNTGVFRCPSYLDYYKNVYVIRSPFDINIKVNVENPLGEDSKYITIDNYGQEFFDKYFVIRDAGKNNKTLLSFVIQYMFYSDEPVEMECLHPVEHKNSFTANTSVVQGVFDISKWIRPVECAFTIHDDSEGIKIKRGDPLYYVRFVTNKKVKLDKVKYTPELDEVVESLVQVKAFQPNNSMQENYSIAHNYLTKFSGLFKKKKRCPFSFLIRKD